MPATLRTPPSRWTAGIEDNRATQGTGTVHAQARANPCPAAGDGPSNHSDILPANYLVLWVAHPTRACATWLVNQLFRRITSPNLAGAPLSMVMRVAAKITPIVQVPPVDAFVHYPPLEAEPVRGRVVFFELRLPSLRGSERDYGQFGLLGSHSVSFSTTGGAVRRGEPWRSASCSPGLSRWCPARRRSGLTAPTVARNSPS
jgi:hypothetical protein